MNLINDKERRVMTALYRLGESTINSIAKETLINRTALYHTAKCLFAKGLITEVSKEKVAYWSPISLDDYRAWIDTRIKSLSDQGKEDVERFKTNRSEKPVLYADVKYFEGQDALKSLYADTWRDNKDKEIRAITDYTSAYETLGKFFEGEYFKDRVREGVRVKNLLPESKYGKRDFKTSKALLRDMKFIDLFRDLGIELNIYQSKVSVVAFDKKHPIGVIIKNDIIANAFRNIFDYLWKSAHRGSSKA